MANAESIPPAGRAGLWTQVPAAAGPVDRKRGRFPLFTDENVEGPPSRP